nr:RAMP superfamily CRISPR-associated protein [Methanobrevibacter gottschalkii]
METLRFKGNLTALSPIHHGDSEDYGTTKLILTLPTVIINPLTGKEEIDNIPTIHGNAIRGYLRRLIMDDFLTQLDYELDSKKVYHFLFTGGILEALDSKDKGAINLSLKKKIRELIPPISLVGSALGNQMIQGKLKVGMADIVCAETKHYIEEYSDYDFSAYNLKGSDFGTRLDDLKEGETEEDEQAHQMKYEFETLIRGTKFTHEFILEDCNSIEKACFHRMMSLWEERPYLGGKSGTGYGKVRLDYQGIDDLTDISYLNYLHDRKEEISNLLDELVKIWK